MSTTTSTQPSGSSYVQRQINLTIQLGMGAFGSSGQNTVKLSNLRMKVDIEKGGFPSMDQAQIRVYGVQPQVMNQVSTLGIPLAMIRIGNIVTVEAGDAVNGMAIVYSGYMHECYQDFSDPPETSLQINAYGGLPAAFVPATPSSFPGTSDVATIMSGFATALQWKFENNGVQVKLSNAYFPGTALQQIHDLARAANIEMCIDHATKPPTLAIWPKIGTRGGQIPLISAATGLVGYPKFQSNGMSFTTLFNPSIRLGAQIQMQSTVGQAPQNIPASAGLPPGTQSGGPNGLWQVAGGGDGALSHDLSSQLPDGPWFTHVYCVRVPGPTAKS